VESPAWSTPMSRAQTIVDNRVLNIEKLTSKAKLGMAYILSIYSLTPRGALHAFFNQPRNGS
jgi:hypothetical protein